MYVRYVKNLLIFLAKVGDSSWWITGGLSEDGSTNSTEVFNEALLLPNKMDDGPTLPFQIYGHCMLTLPNDSVRNVRLCLHAFSRILQDFSFFLLFQEFQSKSNLIIGLKIPTGMR